MGAHHPLPQCRALPPGELRPIERLKLLGGVRREFAELDVGTFRTIASTNPSTGGVTVQGGKPTFQETLYNAGVVFQATDWGQLFANYSEGFGMPDVGRVLRGISREGQSVDDFLALQPIVTDNRVPAGDGGRRLPGTPRAH